MFKSTKTAAELQQEALQKANEDRVSEIDARLEQIDLESVRPLRAINSGNNSQSDIDKLSALDSEAETLRLERANLV